MIKYISLMFVATASADGLYDSSPMNFDNNIMNYENSPMNYNSNRIIRDDSGNATGYAVPKANGGLNIYNLDGIREGYLYE